MTLLCSHTRGGQAAFEAQSYCKQGKEALEHIFKVAGGLDSQILGDYEIVGQIKKAYQFSRDRGNTGPFLDRLFNTVLQSSRAIRSNTRLSSGTVSVAFAAVQFIKELGGEPHDKKILIIGSGKIGQNACRNLLGITHAGNITLMNRTAGKAEVLAAALGLCTAPFGQLRDCIRSADVIIVATAAAEPLITAAELPDNTPKVLIDLSVPNNIDTGLASFPHLTLANVDDLSRRNDETLQSRRQEVPKALDLIRHYSSEFLSWYHMQQHVPVLKAVKQKLYELNTRLATVPGDEGDHAVQKALNTMAKRMRTGEEQKPGCHYIQTIHHYLEGAVI